MIPIVSRLTFYFFLTANLVSIAPLGSAQQAQTTANTDQSLSTTGPLATTVAVNATQHPQIAPNTDQSRSVTEPLATTVKVNAAQQAPETGKIHARDGLVTKKAGESEQVEVAGSDPPVVSSRPSRSGVEYSARLRVQTGRTDIGFFAEDDYTRRSSGRFITNYQIAQTMLPGYGGAVEYRRWFRKNDAASLLFSGTPAASRLYLMPGTYTWPVKRFEFDLLWSHKVKSAGTLLSPFTVAGSGAIALNGGSDVSGSGWDRQWPIVIGGGDEIRISRSLSIRVETLVDFVKASTFSDQTYRSSWTFAYRPLAGIVWKPIRSRAEQE